MKPFAIITVTVWSRQMTMTAIHLADPVLKGAVHIKGDLQHKISFMKGKVWGGTIQGASGVFNDRLTHEDFELIKSKMVFGKSQKKRSPGKVIRRGPQRNQSVHRYPTNQPSERQQCLFKFYEADIEERILSMLGEMNLKLYHDLKTGKTGKQFVIDGGRIDLLCTDKHTGDFVIIELKKGEAPKETLLQILRYISWVKQHMTAKGKIGVKGIILTEYADTDLQHYMEEVPNVDIQYYKVSISLV